MQINSQTPQPALERLYRAVTRRELLRGTPLNPRWLLRFALLFLLFPGMVCGFWVGLGLTLAFCIALLCLLGMDHTAAATLAAQVWLGGGACVFVGFCALALRSAFAQRRLRESPRPPAEPTAATTGAPPLPLTGAGAQPLRWRPRGSSADSSGSKVWECALSLQAPAPGIYALLLSVQSVGRRRLLTLGQQGVCIVHTATTAGGDMQSLLLYKLEAGQHTLRWELSPRGHGSAPPASATLLCHPAAPAAQD